MRLTAFASRRLLGLGLNGGMSSLPLDLGRAVDMLRPMRFALVALCSLALSCGFDPISETCIAEDECSINCTGGGGGCRLDCYDQSTCSSVCLNGGCTYKCFDNATCQFQCPGGNCEIDCFDNALCAVNCQGGFCNFGCDPNTSCSGMCPDASCEGNGFQ